MSRRKHKKNEDEVLIESTEIPLVLPFGTIEQNVSWYIKSQGKKMTYGDLISLKPYLNAFNEFKEVIDNL